MEQKRRSGEESDKREERRIMNSESKNRKTGNTVTGPGGLLSAPKQDFLASVVVFLVALQLCMGRAIAYGVPVAAGLSTGNVGGLVVG